MKSIFVLYLMYSVCPLINSTNFRHEHSSVKSSSDGDGLFFWKSHKTPKFLKKHQSNSDSGSMSSFATRENAYSTQGEKLEGARNIHESASEVSKVVEEPALPGSFSNVSSTSSRPAIERHHTQVQNSYGLLKANAPKGAATTANDAAATAKDAATAAKDAATAAKDVATAAKDVAITATDARVTTIYPYKEQQKVTSPGITQAFQPVKITGSYSRVTESSTKRQSDERLDETVQSSEHARSKSQDLVYAYPATGETQHSNKLKVIHKKEIFKDTGSVSPGVTSTHSNDSQKDRMKAPHPMRDHFQLPMQIRNRLHLPVHKSSSDFPYVSMMNKESFDRMETLLGGPSKQNDWVPILEASNQNDAVKSAPAVGSNKPENMHLYNLLQQQTHRTPVNNGIGSIIEPGAVYRKKTRVQDERNEVNRIGHHNDQEVAATVPGKEVGSLSSHTSEPPLDQGLQSSQIPFSVHAITNPLLSKAVSPVFHQSLIHRTSANRMSNSDNNVKFQSRGSSVLPLLPTHLNQLLPKKDQLIKLGRPIQKNPAIVPLRGSEGDQAVADLLGFAPQGRPQTPDSEAIPVAEGGAFGEDHGNLLNVVTNPGESVVMQMFEQVFSKDEMDHNPLVKQLHDQLGDRLSSLENNALLNPSFGFLLYFLLPFAIIAVLTFSFMGVAPEYLGLMGLLIPGVIAATMLKDFGFGGRAKNARSNKDGVWKREEGEAILDYLLESVLRHLDSFERNHVTR